MGFFQHIGETVSQGISQRALAIRQLLSGHKIFQAKLQLAWIGKVVAVEIEMEHGIPLPFLFHLVDFQPLEQLLSALEIALQGRHEQRLAESPRTTQKINVSVVYQVIDKISLVEINITTFYDSVETLYAYRIFHVVSSVIRLRKVTTLS